MNLSENSSSVILFKLGNRLSNTLHHCRMSESLILLYSLFYNFPIIEIVYYFTFNSEGFRPRSLRLLQLTHMEILYIARNKMLSHPSYPIYDYYRLFLFHDHFILLYAANQLIIYIFRNQTEKNRLGLRHSLQYQTQPGLTFVRYGSTHS